MDIDIEKIADKLKKGAEDNFNIHGHISPIAFILKGGSMVMLPMKILKLFTDEREKFYEILKSMVKSIQPQPSAVILISEIWFIIDKENGVFEQPSKSKNRREAVLLTVDTIGRQLTYISEIKNKAMGEWKIFSDHDKTKPNKMQLRGNLIDFFNTGVEPNLNVPAEMYQKPKGTGGELPIIDK